MQSDDGCASNPLLEVKMSMQDILLLFVEALHLLQETECPSSEYFRHHCQLPSCVELCFPALASLCSWLHLTASSVAESSPLVTRSAPSRHLTSLSQPDTFLYFREDRKFVDMFLRVTVASSVTSLVSL